MRARLAAISILAIAAGGCSTTEVMVAHSVPLERATTGYADADLLDVGILVLGSGLPDGELDREVIEELMQDGTFVQIRRAEAMFLAVQLRETLQKSGQWGSVWVTPRESTAVDLNVHGEILQSDGSVVELRVSAEDSTGRKWLDKKYDMETARSAYNRQAYPDLDPYQDVLNEIANDLARYRATLGTEQVADIRSLGELRYAGEVSPEAFGDYVSESGGRYEPQRLPAEDDPTYQRTRSVRQREQLLFETLDLYYEQFALDAMDSYDSWREYSRDYSIRLHEAARAAKVRTAMGALAIAASIAYGNQSDSSSLADRVIRDAGIYIGSDLIRMSGVRRQERRIYTQQLQELSEDFDDSVEPLVVDIQGTQHRLTGTADERYQQWKDLIRELFISETGFVPEDINVYAEPAQETDDDASPDAAAVPDSGSEQQESAPDANGGTATTARAQPAP